jgi:Asp-tRNA(Asn)/Glu-tRNA(Gln) amidotransferase A subunit family amidase
MLAELAAQVRAGHLDPVDLVHEALERIARHNPTLNAAVMLRADAAIVEALQAPRHGALAGLPVLVKDTMAVAGMRCTHGGHPLWADAPPDTRDDPAVARLRAAGAIIIGRTNAPSFGHTGLTTSPLYGTTRNPWNPEHTPGGSSGGAAAALASGMVPLASSSDGGGSTRSPASMCGLVGYKPTLGLFGRGTPLGSVCVGTPGTMNATVADALLEARVLAGPSAGDIAALPPGAVVLEPSLPRRVLACRSLRGRADPAIRAAFDTTCACIERSLRLPVELIDAPFPPTLLPDFERLYDVETAHTLAPFREHWPTFEPSLRQVCENGLSTPLFEYVGALRRRHEYTALLSNLLGNDTVLVTPVRNRLAARLDGSAAQANAAALQAEVEGITNTMDFNMTGTPAISVPMGLDPHGVPFGFQIAAPRWRDGLAFGLAQAIEQIAPWPLAAPGYTPFGLS